jgi:hypothetical protein
MRTCVTIGPATVTRTVGLSTVNVTLTAAAQSPPAACHGDSDRDRNRDWQLRRWFAWFRRMVGGCCVRMFRTQHAPVSRREFVVTTQFPVAVCIVTLFAHRVTLLHCRMHVCAA